MIWVYSSLNLTHRATDLIVITITFTPYLFVTDWTLYSLLQFTNTRYHDSASNGFNLINQPTDLIVTAITSEIHSFIMDVNFLI